MGSCRYSSLCKESEVHLLILVILFCFGAMRARICQIKMSLPEFNSLRLHSADGRGPNVASTCLDHRLCCGKSADRKRDFLSIFPIFNYLEYDLIENSPRRVLHFQ